MKLPIIPTQKTLQYLGYEEEKIKGVFNWKKKINEEKFPRFHLIIKNNEAGLHIDTDNLHGAFLKWLGKTNKKNIINNNSSIKSEIELIKSTNIYWSAITSRDIINKEINKLGELLKINRQ